MFPSKGLPGDERKLTAGFRKIRVVERAGRRGLKEITGVQREGGKEGAQGLHRSRWGFRLREAEGRGFVEGGP